MVFEWTEGVSLALKLDQIGPRRKPIARSGAILAAVGLALFLAPNSTESAIANGDTRTINLVNPHTNESGAFTYMVGGVYDSTTLEKLNWFLRDWRLNEPTKMDPKLFDIVWEVYHQSGSSQAIEVLSGYRSPSTNAMLRMRSRQVAEHSQHMLGKAMDAHFVDVGTDRIRDIGMRMQSGGVGFYPTGNTPWVHLDTGSVRYWPRMSHDSMVRLFPDGKTVHIPADGVPLPGYEQARAEIEARGGAVMTASAGGASGGANFGILGWLFGRGGGGADDAEEGAGSNNVKVTAKAPKLSPVLPATQVASAGVVPQKETQVASLESAAGANNDLAKARETKSATDLAPLPPRRPIELAAAFGPLEAPLPPTKPVELAAAEPAVDPKTDLIAALLARSKDQLPKAITHGLSVNAPKSALALIEAPPAPQPPERPAILARAEALAMPPMPLSRKKPTPIAVASNAPLGDVSGPYGGIVYGVFGLGDDRSSDVTGLIPAPAAAK